MYAWLNTIGLCVGIIGVGVIFKWGPPQPLLEGHAPLVLSDTTQLPDGGTVAEQKNRISKLRRHFLNMSRVGLGLILVGFILQLIGTWP
jgi:hypothetical protein